MANCFLSPKIDNLFLKVVLEEAAVRDSMHTPLAQSVKLDPLRVEPSPLPQPI
eukprot:XP_001707198.1 Hypothetical protein GL50803_2402 [Giardia lamblia ATCC 50803]